jgi:hypothetical protein
MRTCGNHVVLKVPGAFLYKVAKRKSFADPLVYVGIVGIIRYTQEFHSGPIAIRAYAEPMD